MTVILDMDEINGDLPQAEVAVVIPPLGHTVSDIGSGQHVTTDADGRFRTPPLPVATLALSVRATERRLASVRRPIRPGGEEDLGEIRLEKDVPVVGKVQEENSEPIAGLTIGGMVGHDATTDEQGRFARRGFGPNPSFQMKKKTAGSSPDVAKQTISGKASRDGRPINVGWVGLWAVPRPPVAVNTPVMRGRTVVGGPIVYSSAPIRDGNYTLDVPFQNEDWYVAVEEPGHALTQVGPIPIALKEQKKLDITAGEGGRVSGRVKGVPAAWAGHAWVVAFSKTAVRAETWTSPDGTFSLPLLPPGEYGLKVGHEAYEDAEVYPGTLFREHPESFSKKALDAESSRISLARDCLKALAASRALANASSMVSACVINSGLRGEVTMYPPSSASSRLSTSLPSLTVYLLLMNIS